LENLSRLNNVEVVLIEPYTREQQLKDFEQKVRIVTNLKATGTD